MTSQISYYLCLNPRCSISCLLKQKDFTIINRQAFSATILWPLHQVLKNVKLNIYVLGTYQRWCHWKGWNKTPPQKTHSICTTHSKDKTGTRGGHGILRCQGPFHFWSCGPFNINSPTKITTGSHITQQDQHVHSTNDHMPGVLS